MFGEKDTPDKKSWVDDEFNKRREKRIAKQKRMIMKDKVKVTLMTITSIESHSEIKNPML